jgi:hypothetical protein
MAMTFTSTQPNYVFVVLLEFYPSWLALPRERRRQLASELYEIAARARDRVRTRFFDAEAFADGTYTDFVICETADPKAYHFLWEQIRDTPVYHQGYMKIKNVLLGLENGYVQYEREALGMA